MTAIATNQTWTMIDTPNAAHELAAHLLSPERTRPALLVTWLSMATVTSL